MLRREEKNGKITGATWMLLGWFTTILLFPIDIAVAALIFLSIGALSFGYLFKSYFMGSYSDVFWDHSIAHHHGDHHDIPLIIYYMPAIVGIFGLITAWYMYLKNTKLIMLKNGLKY